VFPREAETPADPESSTVDPARPEDFRRLIREISAAEGLPCRGVVYLWGLDATSLADMTPDRLELAEALGAGGALFLTQALAEARSASAFTPRLWFVTRNAQSVAPGPVVEPAQAPLWGLGRTVALEYPALWGGLIDLPPASRTAAREAAEALAAELLQGDREGEVALRDGKRFVARLAHLPREGAGAQPARFHDDATYLITGGLGMLGLTVARWLAERQGARSLVLVGRRPVEGPARDVVEALRGRGVALHVVQADVSVEADVRRVMNEIRRGGLPLKGVFHCAGVLDDGVLAQMDWGQFTRVTAPKIRGSWLLHHHTRDVRLEFFVLHSSLLSLTGSAGQANYTAANAFLDALAAHRRGLGLPAMVVNWGPLADAGMTAATGSRGAAIWRARGTRFIPPEDGMSVLEHLMHRGVDQAAVAITDWTTYLQQFSEPPPLYAELTREVGAGRAPRHSEGDGELQARLREAPAGAQRSLLFAAIREQVMDELGFDDDIDPGQRLNELGLDSLMSVNVANRLERVLGIAVPLAKLIRGPSLHELTDELLPHLAGAAEVAEAAEDRVVATQIVRPEAPTGISPAGVSASSRDGWLVLPRPNPSAKVRLFCFHYAGGGAATFRPWADTLDPAIELVAIEPPGRGGRADEPPVETLDAFVEQLIPAIAPYLDKPFALFGHCLGALTLFETARHLLARHPLPLEHVFVSGARPPHLVAREGPFEREMLAHLLQHPEFDPFRPGHDQPDDVFADMLRRFNIGATDEFLRNPELRRLLLPLVRADFAMAACHRFTPAPPWEAPVTCFVGLGDPYVSREDALEWGRYTRVAFRLWMRETAHFLIVDDRAFILDTINRELGR
jgi:surfactin synthase thioesterase subunit/NAD(P)-dependent dehydrogenase (short-subunit alcohol dehydrogenase family)/acyl carrier protein